MEVLNATLPMKSYLPSGKSIDLSKVLASVQSPPNSSG